MSAIVFDPSLHVWEKPVSLLTATTISRLAFVCDTGTLNFNVKTVLHSSRRCLSKSLETNPTAHEYLQEFLQAIDQSLQDVTDRNVPDSSTAIGFMSGDTPWVKVLARLPKNASDDLLECIGNAICTAILSDTVLSKQKGKRLLSLAMATLRNPQLTATQLRDLEVLLVRGRLALTEMLTLRQATDDVRLLHFSAAFLTHLRSDLNSMHQKKQQAADLRAFLSREQLITEIAELLKAIESEDKRALEALICFSVHLSRDLIRQVPILRKGGTSGSVMWLDADEGVFHVRLEQLLAELGSAVQGGMKTTELMRLQLPDLLAKPIQQLVALNPAASFLGELLASEETNASRSSILLSESHLISLTRTAPALAIRLLQNRVVCSFSFLAFYLLTKPDLHYLTITQTAIDEFRARFFEDIGLGKTSSINSRTTAIGSKRMPQPAVISSLFDELDKLNDELKVGRRYTLEGLVRYHNAYCRRVGLFLQLVSGARGSHHISFSSASWFFGSPFGYLDDKDAGTAGGRTPIPISPKTSLQLKFWDSHLQSLYRRLVKVGGFESKATLTLITDILEHREVPLLFLLGIDGTSRPVFSSDLISSSNKQVSRDFGRHFFASILVEQAHTLQDVQAFLRHQGGGVNPQAAYGIEVHNDRLMRIALTVDSTLERLSIAPLKGLSGGKK